MKRRNETQEELDRLAPALARLKSALPDQKEEVPRGYFEGLPGQVMERLQAAEKASSPLRLVHKSKPGRYPRGTIAAIAAALAVLIGALLWVCAPARPANTASSAGLAELDQAAAAEYIENNIADFELSLMEEAALIDESTVSKLDLLPEVEKGSIEHYLEEEIEYEDLNDLF